MIGDQNTLIPRGVRHFLIGPIRRAVMGLVRVRGRKAANILRQRLIHVLTSKAAHRIDFHIDGIHLRGFEVGRVLTHLLLTRQGHGSIVLRTGDVMEGAGATYYPLTNQFDFPSETYGADADERASIFHECVHAWMDARVPTQSTPADAAMRLLLRQSKVAEEATAYIAESLYYIYEATTAGRLPEPSVQTNPVYVEADRIAAYMKTRPGTGGEPRLLERKNHGSAAV
jgi:hypothetical protein